LVTEEARPPGLESCDGRPRLSAQVGETPLSLTMSQIAEKTGVEGIA
jgi:hypothetical protein